MTKRWCVGGKYQSETMNQIVYENANPKTKKIVEVIKGSCSICGREKSQDFTEQKNKQTKLSKVDKNQKGAKCINNHSSAMSNTARCDLNTKCDTLELHDICPNPKSRC